MRLDLARAAAALALSFVSLLPALAQTNAPPSVDEVMSLKARRADDGSIELAFAVAPGVYLYRDKIAATSGGQPIRVETPTGKTKDDPTFGAVEIYDHDVAARVDPRGVDPTKPLDVTYQGCAARGVCYPPVTGRIDLAQIAAPGSTAAASPLDEVDRANIEAQVADWAATGGFDAAPPERTSSTSTSTPDLTAGLAPDLDGSLALVLATFFGLGLLLCLTPCVYPMIPILVGVLARAGETLSAKRGFALSGAYALAMAAAYATLGVAAAWSGQNLQTALQTPAALTIAAVIFAVLALSMFGVLQLQAPGAVASRLSAVAARARGSVLGAAALGFVSALIVGPCVTPPLAAALVYVAQTGDMARGSAALFAMGLGMGAPLVAVGLFGARILPKSGPWLVTVKQGFGVVFLAIALMLVGRVAPPAVTLAFWAAFAIGLGVFLGALDALGRRAGPARRLAKAAGLLALVYGVALVVGVASGADDPSRPLGRLAAAPRAPKAAGSEITVADVSALKAALLAAQAAGRPSLVTFTATWCSTCAENERLMADDEELQDRLNAFAAIKVDVTRNDERSRDAMKALGVVGPPTMIVFGRQGAEIPRQRTTGAVDVDRLNEALRHAAET
ncbi:thiol:disulfide interchange protein DsbD [Methylopila capsulata]|uniref:Thiol:disulfide interchange protein DsbD n=1 Tax=Methylopila capsulata TaxID=61654 RepID=A0A9W6MSU2_9HYPH|nr:protein-disulfide reductase DsbD [Methylopila capsulata]MBM7852430.1 thiol:disulfide interchange protein DsbD [Methylopila capsulata]GLK56639.1 thiol:disulfide interchange protein DsbD [Methylopila capsulata]